MRAFLMSSTMAVLACGAPSTRVTLNVASGSELGEGVTLATGKIIGGSMPGSFAPGVDVALGASTNVTLRGAVSEAFCCKANGNKFSSVGAIPPDTEACRCEGRPPGRETAVVIGSNVVGEGTGAGFGYVVQDVPGKNFRFFLVRSWVESDGSGHATLDIAPAD